MKDIVNARVRYGFSQIHTLLKREGFVDNHKRTYRDYKEEGLNLRSKRPRNLAEAKLAPTGWNGQQATSLHQCWSMDSVADQLFEGRKFKALT